MRNESRILLAANYSPKTGFAWNNILGLFDSIAIGMQEHGVGVCISFAKPGGEAGNIYKEKKYVTFEYDPTSRSIAESLKLCMNILKFNIKYIYLTDQPTVRALYVLLRIIGVKKIIIHNRVSVPRPFPAIRTSGIKRVVKIIFNRIPVLRSDKVYAVSEFVSDRLQYQNCYPKDRIVVIYNGVDTRAFECSQKENTEIMHIFSAGRASRYKGFDVLIEALSILLIKRPDLSIKWRFAGEGPDMEYFKEVAKSNSIEEICEFIGYLPNTRSELCRANIIVIPSNWGDACPSAVIEAMASGRAVISTKAGGIPELLCEDCGILVEPGNAEELSFAIEQLIDDPVERNTMSVKAKCRASEMFDLQRYHGDVVKQILKDIGVC